MLPPYIPISPIDPSYKWGSAEGSAFCLKVDRWYDKVVHWRRNVFSIPSGKAGKDFVSEMARLYQAYAEGPQIESFTLTAAMILPSLILQKPYPGSKAKEHVKCIERRMTQWRDRDIDSLRQECITIQQHLQPLKGTPRDNLARSFANLVMQGKVKSALRLLSSDSRGTPLSLDKEITSSTGSDTIRDILHKKHPPSRPVYPSAILPEEAPSSTHPILLESITGQLVRTTAIHTEGTAGPSGLDAADWRRMCSSIHDASRDRCNAVAAVGCRLCTTFVDPVGLKALTSCRLIAMDKQPGVRPIGIGEVARRIIGKAILSIIKDDVLKVAGVQQLCVGQQSGCEAAIHAMRSVFELPSCHAILQQDATSACNNLNRNTALINIFHSCPSIAPARINTYRHESSLYIGGEIIPSRESTTQGDPLAMAMFALATLPLVNKLSRDLKQCWYADDASAGGELQHIWVWWDGLTQMGPQYGYFPNPEKTWLVVKEEHYEAANATFAGSGTLLTRLGRQYLGSAIGSAAFSEAFVKMKVEGLVYEIEQLSLIAKTHHHAAYAAYTHGLGHKWKFLLRAIPNIGNLLTPLETAIRHSLIPSITGKSDLNDHKKDHGSTHPPQWSWP